MVPTTASYVNWQLIDSQAIPLSEVTKLITAVATDMWSGERKDPSAGTDECLLRVSFIHWGENEIQTKAEHGSD